MAEEKEKELSSGATENNSTDSSSDVNSVTNSSISQDELSKYSKKDKGRHFAYVVYPESAPEDWIEQLRNTGLAFVVSPLHDKDVNPDGTKKKPHWHVIISWGNSTTYASAKKIAEDTLKCPRPEILKNPTGMYRYLTHKDNPEKYQYLEAPKTYNGWERPLDSNEVAEIKKWIYKAIYIEDCQEYGELLTVCIQEGPEYFDVASNNTFYCEKLCTSYRHNPIRGLKRYYNSLEEGETKEAIKARIDELERGQYES